jgi:predicted nucleotidyltransferase
VLENVRSLQDIPLTENDRRAIEEAADLLRRRFPVKRIELFGSKARGDDDAESDIDLLVLTTRPVDRTEKNEMMRSLFDLELRREVVITPLIIAEEDWEHGLYQVLPLRREVERDGVAA